jgi:hypothetical protein
VTPPAPERALRLALIGWGLGDLAMGRQIAGYGWLGLEILMLTLTTAAAILLADTTWYLLPYLLGVAFLALWAAQAVRAYRGAQRMQAASGPSRPRSPAATVAWLTIPLLAWGAGFWIIGADAATPATVVDEFMTRWPAAVGAASDEAYAGIAQDPAVLSALADEALDTLQSMCDSGQLAADCDAADENLVRDVRVTVTYQNDTRATADAELVRYERVPTTVLGIFEGTETVPVPVATVLRLDLEAVPAALGARRWVIVNAEAG